MMLRNVLAILLISYTAGIPAERILVNGDAAAAYSIETETLEIAKQTSDGDIVITDGLSVFAISDLAESGTEARWVTEGLSIHCSVAGDGALEMRVAGEPGATFTWPIRTIGDGSQLILARDSGIMVPPDDPFWREVLLNSDWDTLESMSMPVWGILENGRCTSFMVTTPFRNRLRFADSEAGLVVTFSHHFHPKSPETEFTLRIYTEEDVSPITPALRYRAFLDEISVIRTLNEQAEAIPAIDRLLGAAHVYLWGDQTFTRFDLPRQKWKPFCADLISRVENEDDMALKLHEALNSEQWSLVQECVETEWPHDYMKQQIAMGISGAIDSGSINAADFAESFSGYVLPVEEWGNGDSLKLLDRLKEAGYDRLKLCFPGWESVARRPWVAESAAERGWLMGTYDSYHSIHNPATAGSDNSWSTAQMTQELWETGGVMREDGTYRYGFKKIGKKLSPLAARDYFKERVSKNLATPFNYYFIDCDATGEVYDDYHSDHPNSMENCAAERLNRLRWLSTEKGLVVGTEGGKAYAVGSAHVFEGVFGPYFGWDEPAMKDRSSEYYRGRYYPPDEPEINFKPIPIKDRYVKLLFDPAVRIPLFQAAFHDAAVTTHHWSNDWFKYPELRGTVSLFEVLYMSPPMVHLNLSTFAERDEAFRPHYTEWSELHRKLGFSKLIDFRHLTADRLVQEVTWEDGTRIVANFGEGEYSSGDTIVPPGEFIVHPEPTTTARR